LIESCALEGVDPFDYAERRCSSQKTTPPSSTTRANTHPTTFSEVATKVCHHAALLANDRRIAVGVQEVPEA
jgi:hypothetical protein